MGVDSGWAALEAESEAEGELNVSAAEYCRASLTHSLHRPTDMFILARMESKCQRARSDSVIYASGTCKVQVMAQTQYDGAISINPGSTYPIILDFSTRTGEPRTGQVHHDVEAG